MKLKVEDLAKACHETNKMFCELVGDFSQVPWKNAAEWQKDSAVKGVAYMLENPDATSEELHQEWLDEKVKAGWQYGAVKDETKKEHPAMVPYEQLPIEQQVKDKLFSSVVNSLKVLL